MQDKTESQCERFSFEPRERRNKAGKKIVRRATRLQDHRQVVRRRTAKSPVRVVQAMESGLGAPGILSSRQRAERHPSQARSLRSGQPAGELRRFVAAPLKDDRGGVVPVCVFLAVQPRPERGKMLLFPPPDERTDRLEPDVLGRVPPQAGMNRIT